MVSPMFLLTWFWTVPHNFTFNALLETDFTNFTFRPTTWETKMGRLATVSYILTLECSPWEFPKFFWHSWANCYPGPHLKQWLHCLSPAWWQAWHYFCFWLLCLKTLLAESWFGIWVTCDLWNASCNHAKSACTASKAAISYSALLPYLTIYSY